MSRTTRARPSDRTAAGRRGASSRSGRRRGEGPLLLIVGPAGAATMVVELGAVRVLAPWFGTSSSVWTNVIGVVLAAARARLHPRRASGRWPSAPARPRCGARDGEPVLRVAPPGCAPGRRSPDARRRAPASRGGRARVGESRVRHGPVPPRCGGLGARGPLAVESSKATEAAPPARPAGACSPPRRSEVSSGRSGRRTGRFRPWGSPPPTSRLCLAARRRRPLVMRTGRPGAARSTAAGVTVLLCGVAVATDAASRPHSGDGPPGCGRVSDAVDPRRGGGGTRRETLCASSG